jgi:tRNA dimethylallyltransferase
MPVPARRVVFLFGPTGAGKTELAVSAARGIAEIISVDSMQVYRGMDRATAKPSPQQLREVRHHLIDIVPPDYRFSAGDFTRRAVASIEDIVSRGKVPLLVGGTGLYFKSLEFNLSDAPPADLAFRERLYREEEERAGSLHERLRFLDPETARRLHPRDLIRIVRALEIHRSMGLPFSDFRKLEKPKRVAALKFCLTRDREELNGLLEGRCRRIIESGLPDEVGVLLRRGYDERCPSMKGLGYSHFIRYVKGCSSRLETERLFIRDTKRYAKRQLTWFRREEDARWIGAGDAARVREAILSLRGS